MNLSYEDQQFLFERFSDVMTLLEDDRAEWTKPEPKGKSSLVENLKDHIISPEKQISKAKRNIREAIRNLFPNYTYKKGALAFPKNPAHALVKLSEALESAMSKTNDPYTNMQFQKLQNSIDQLLMFKASPVVTIEANNARDTKNTPNKEIDTHVM